MPSCPTLRVALPVPLPQTFDYLPPPGSPEPSQADVAKLRSEYNALLPVGQRKTWKVA